MFNRNKYICILKVRAIYYLSSFRLCVFSLPISLVIVMWIRVLCLIIIIIIKTEAWTVFHCLRLGNKTMICFSMFSPIYVPACIAYITHWSDIYGVRMAYMAYMTLQQGFHVNCTVYNKYLKWSETRTNAIQIVFEVTYCTMVSFPTWPPVWMLLCSSYI